MNAPDTILLRKWSERRDAEAFAEIVRRHSAMVYAACKRILRNNADAEEVTQECFLKLAQAHSPIRSSLAGWLHALATHRAMDRIKADARRREREMRYSNTLNSSTSVEWDDIRPLVDEAIASLPEKLRHPIISHFLEGQSHDAIAMRCGISQPTVTRRIQKGVEETRKCLKRRGVPIGAGAIVSLLTANAAEAVSAGLLQELGRIALAGPGGTAAMESMGAAGKVVGGILALKKVIAAALALLVGSIGVWTFWPEDQIREAEFEPSTPVSIAEESRSETTPSLLTFLDSLREQTQEDQPTGEPEQEVPTITENGLIYGETVDSATGAPISNTVVLLTRPFEREVHADSQGEFRLEGLAPGDYTVYARHPRWVMNGRPFTVHLREDQEPAHVRISMVRGGIVVGRITDADSGEGIPGVELRALDSGAGRNHREGIKTDSEGFYRIEGLVGEEHVIYVVDDADGAYVPERPPSRVLAGLHRARLRITPGKEHRVDFQLERINYVELSGVVIDLEGHPVPGAPIWAGWGLQRTPAGESDRKGEFLVKVPDPGRPIYAQVSGETVISDPIGPLQVPEGGLHDLVLTLYPTGGIAGSVISGLKDALPGMDVVLTRVKPEWPLSTPSNVTTDESGSFVFDGLMAGQYLLLARRPHERYLSENDMIFPLRPEAIEALVEKGAIKVSLGRGERIRDAVLEYPQAGGYIISGRVVNGKGIPVERASLIATGPPENLIQGLWGRRVDANSDSDGRFQLLGLLGGNYTLRASRYRTHETAELANVAAGTSDLEIVLHEKPVIEGHVVHAITSQPIRQFEVCTQPAQRHRINPYDLTTIYNEEGRFRIRSAYTGQVNLWVRASGFSLKKIALQLRPDEIRAGVTVRLDPSHRVEGRVVDISRMPVAGAAIYPGAPVLRPRDGTEFHLDPTYSQSDGSFVFDHEESVPKLICVVHPDYARTSVPVHPDRTGSAYVEVILDSGGTVEGTLTASRGRGVRLRVPGDESLGILNTHTVSGHYRFPHVPPGTVEIILDERRNHQRRRQAVVKSGGTTVVDFQIQEGPCSLLGSVSANGQPGVGGHILLHIETVEETLVRLSRIEQGEYQFTGLPPGLAHLQVVSRSPMRMKEFWIDLIEGEETIQDIDFSGSGALFGTVSGQSAGEQCWGILVPGEVESPEIGLFGRSVAHQGNYTFVPPVVFFRVDTDGVFIMDPMEPGRYTVFIRAFAHEPKLYEADLANYTKQAVGYFDIENDTETSIHLELR